jgi:hypothetical protein
MVRARGGWEAGTEYADQRRLVPWLLQDVCGELGLFFTPAAAARTARRRRVVQAACAWPLALVIALCRMDLEQWGYERFLARVLLRRLAHGSDLASSSPSAV